MSKLFRFDVWVHADSEEEARNLMRIVSAQYALDVDELGEVPEDCPEYLEGTEG
jgi:hypothetical protein